MLRLFTSLASLLLIIGCSDSLPDVQPICNGSDEARLVYTDTGGFFPFDEQFTAKYGRNYLVLDGKCKYWLGRHSLRGLSVGSIDATLAAKLAEELQFGRYATARGARGEPCPDSGVAYLKDVTGTLIDVSCGRAADATLVWRAAFNRVRRLSTELEADAEPYWESSSLLVLTDPQPVANRAFEWTAPLELESIAIEYPQSPREPAGFPMDPATLAFVSSLRQQVIEGGDLDPFVLFVKDRQARYYRLYLRDDPPARIASALEEVLTTNW